METHSISRMFYMIIDEATALFIFVCRRITKWSCCQKRLILGVSSVGQCRNKYRYKWLLMLLIFDVNIVVEDAHLL